MRKPQISTLPAARPWPANRLGDIWRTRSEERKSNRDRERQQPLSGGRGKPVPRNGTAVGRRQLPRSIFGIRFRKAAADGLQFHRRCSKRKTPGFKTGARNALQISRTPRFGSRFRQSRPMGNIDRLLALKQKRKPAGKDAGPPNRKRAVPDWMLRPMIPGIAPESAEAKSAVR